METQITAIKSVLVPIAQSGKNYLPFVEDLKGRVIRFIDFIPVLALPGSSEDVFTEFENSTITLADENGNTYFSYQVPLSRYNPLTNFGVRIPINRRISMQNSYVEVLASNQQIGNTALMVVYYDNDQYNHSNTTNDLAVNAFEVKIQSSVFKNLFPDNRTMVNKRFRRFTLPQITTTPSYSDCCNLTAGLMAYITLQKNNYVIVENLPLALIQEPFYLYSLGFKNIEFDFTNSYITVGGVGQNADANMLIGKSIFINCTYENN